VLSGWAAWTRDDLDLMLVRYAPDCDFEPFRELVAAGMRSSYHGHAGLREIAADLREAWEGMDLFPQEIVDAGNPFVVLGRFHPRARGSRIEFESAVGQVLWVERGLIVRDHINNWDEALHVAGIPATAAWRSPSASAR
jgi:hypothetical protein